MPDSGAVAGPIGRAISDTLEGRRSPDPLDLYSLVPVRGLVVYAASVVVLERPGRGRGEIRGRAIWMPCDSPVRLQIPESELSAKGPAECAFVGPVYPV